MNGKLCVIDNAVLLLPKIDKSNGYMTLANNSVANKTLIIKGQGYEILKLIYNNPGVEKYDLVNKLSFISKETVDEFIALLIKENIVFEK